MVFVVAPASVETTAQTCIFRFFVAACMSCAYFFLFVFLFAVFTSLLSDAE